MTLTEFLLARIAEDEAAARAALGPARYSQFGSAAQEAIEIADGEGVAAAGTDHYDRHNPDRVLAECEAKRRIVDKASRFAVRNRAGVDLSNVVFFGDHIEVQGYDVTDEWRAWVEEHGEPADPETLRILATVYADHPDYDEGWRA